MSRPIRTFVAVEMPPEISSRVDALIQKLKVAQAKVSWVSPGNMHLTLKFLGDVLDREVPAICEAVSRASGAVSAFEMVVEGVGAFPNVERPRTLWLGASEGSDRMAELYTAIDEELGKLGYRQEGRRFKPHLTIGRVRGQSPATTQLIELLEKHRDFEAGALYVEETAVLSSDRGPQGSLYEPLGHAELRPD